MPRIRSVKPDFFRDEVLQDLPWNPRMLHLDILPFIEFDFSASLELLREAQLISPYEGVDGKRYGSVLTFAKHQRISGKEATEPAKFPQKLPGSNGESTEQLPVALGREGEMEGKGEAEPALHPLHYAHKMIQVLSIPSTQANMRAIEAALTAECQFTGTSLEDCAQAISDHAMRARAQGSAIDKFYFEDTKWRSNGSRKQTSAAVERVNRNRGNLLEAVRSHVADRTGPDGGKR
jgi:hypothetical protein